jgi:hypothetical protein
MPRQTKPKVGPAPRQMRGFRAAPELIARLDRLAAAEDRPMSSLLRRLVKRGLEAEERAGASKRASTPRV